MKTRYISIEEVLFILDQAVKRFGGSFGIRDIGLIESAVGRPQASFGGDDLYETIFDKAAAFMHSLLKNHAFVDGNKRTSLACVGIFLKINGYDLENMGKDELKFAMEVENETLSLEDIAQWLGTHAKRKRE